MAAFSPVVLFGLLRAESVSFAVAGIQDVHVASIGRELLMVVALRRRDALVAELVADPLDMGAVGESQRGECVAHLPWLALVEAGARADVQGPGL
jgi:hypothetical protein